MSKTKYDSRSEASIGGKHSGSNFARHNVAGSIFEYSDKKGISVESSSSFSSTFSVLERFSIECRKTKVITLANQKGR